MTAWFRRACASAFNLGLTIGELKRRVHGRLDDRHAVNLAIALEAQLQADECEGRDDPDERCPLHPRDCTCWREQHA